MTEIKLYKTPIKGIKIIGMCLPILVMGIWQINEESAGTTAYVMYWLGTCFFGLGIPIGIFQAFDKRPQIIISVTGIWDRTTNQDEVKWEQIIEAYPLCVNGQKFISLATDEKFVFKKRLYKWAVRLNKQIGAQNLNLSLGQIKIDEFELVDFINRLSQKNIEERSKLLKTFEIEEANFTLSDLQKIIAYILVALTLFLWTLSSYVGF